MKKASIRILSLLMAIIMISGIVPLNVLTVSAATYEQKILDVPWVRMRNDKKEFDYQTGSCGIAAVAMIEAFKIGKLNMKNEGYEVFKAVWEFNNRNTALYSYAHLGYKLSSYSLKNFHAQLEENNPVLLYLRNKKEYHFVLIYGYKPTSKTLQEKDFLVLSPNTCALKNCDNSKFGKTTLEKILQHFPTKVNILFRTGASIFPVEDPVIKAQEFNDVRGTIPVEITCPRKGAVIYYTTDGNKVFENGKPTKTAIKYTGPFQIDKTSTIKAKAKKTGMKNSAQIKTKIKVEQTESPAIELVSIKNKHGVIVDYKVKMTGPSDKAKIKYTLNTGPAVLYDYKGAFKPPLGKNGWLNIHAFAYEPGKIRSVSSFVEYYVTPDYSLWGPIGFTVKKTRSGRGAPETEESNICGIGDSVTVDWSAVDLADEYTVEILKDGNKFDEIVTSTNIYSFVPESAGTYTFNITVTRSSIEDDDEIVFSNDLIVKPDVKVTFKDTDGKTLKEQQVKYGGDAEPPVHPNKEGCNWKNWNGKYTEVKEDSIVTATYTPLQYTVKFENENGETISAAVVNYGEAYPTVPSAPLKQNYSFVGWSKKTGEGNSYTNVNGNVVFEPIYKASSDMPLDITASEAVRSDDAKRYTVSVNISNSSAQTVDGKIIAVIKTANDKVVAIEQKTVSVAASAANQAESLVINSTSDAMKCEVYVVGVDTENSNKTGGALSEKATASVTRTSSTSYSYWSGWSDWSETPATASSTKEVEAKEQIRTRSKETTTGTSPELDGWTQTGTNTEYGAWSSWSSWSETKQTASETKAVETRKVYRYFHYCVGDGAATIAPSTAYAYGKKGPHYQYYTSKRSVDQKVTVGGKSYECAWCGACQYGCKYYYYDKQVTQYRYRTRTATTTYNFERWTDWSNWSDTGFTVSQGVESSETAEYRMLYRYRNLLTGTSNGSTQYIVNEDTSGTPYTLSGNLSSLGTDYAGKYATVMVYKGGNTDPTEAQIEYIGQIKLGTNNSYSFTFIPREEISISTGNYIVSMGIAGTTRLINNVDTIEAPWKYKVTFYDLNGSVIKEDYVNKGEDAVAPALPEVEGMRVTWDKSLKNIIGDMNVYPETEKVMCSVIYVDWANNVVLKTEDIYYGDTVIFPTAPEAEGKVFKGWTVNGESIDENYAVTGTTIVESDYEDVEYTVTFLNKDGSIYSTQKVAYGMSASLPVTAPAEEGYTFVSWDTRDEWWNVKEDVTVHPLFVFAETVATPTVALEEKYFGYAELIADTTTEDAVIHYTTDGSVPTEDAPIYSDEEVLIVNETTMFRLKAFKPGMNESDVMDVTLEVVPEDNYPSVEALTDSKYIIGKDSANLRIKINNPYNYPIDTVGWIITNKATGESLTYENNSFSGSVGTIPVTGLKPDTEYYYEYYVDFEFGRIYSISSDIEEYRYSFTTLTDGADLSNTKVTINKPSTTTINYGYTLILHTAIENLPEGTHIVWSFDGNSFKGDGDNEKCSVYVVNSGDTTVKATVCDKDGKPVLDENGKEISSSVKLTAKAGFFQKLIAFFKNLFRVNMVIDG